MVSSSISDEDTYALDVVYDTDKYQLAAIIDTNKKQKSVKKYPPFVNKKYTSSILVRLRFFSIFLSCHFSGATRNASQSESTVCGERRAICLLVLHGKCQAQLVGFYFKFSYRFFE